MPSPFPGMNPYLENPELWPEVHSRLIIAIAELLVPQVRPKYRVAVEKPVYQMTDKNSVLIGIPDVTVGRSLTNTDKEKFNIAVASPPAKPVIVNLPMPEEVREGYLEVREVGTGDVNCVSLAIASLKHALKRLFPITPINIKITIQSSVGVARRRHRSNIQAFQNNDQG